MIKAHIGPFLFGFTALTALIFLNAVAQQLGRLVGRGLGLPVIGEFFVLSLPHVIALTLPMSILVATLYAFSELTGNNEIMAMAAGGLHPSRLITPLVVVGLGLAGTVYYFNDQILPEANHRLSSLLSDIGSKSPTFELREEIVNEIHTGDDTRYFLRAGSIDPLTNELEDVTIFDLSRAGESRAITAEHGRMAFTSDLRDLVLTLEDGIVLEVSDAQPGTFQRLNYDTQVLPLYGVARELERQTGGSRSDREMTVRMLRNEVDNSLTQQRTVAQESSAASKKAVELALGVRSDFAPGLPVTVAPTADDSVGTATATLPGAGAEDIASATLVRDVARVHRISRARWDVHRLSSAHHIVEIQKKYAIAFACIIFVLLGPPLAIRFPQGGVGMVIAASVGIFFLYWMGLIGGERFADDGRVNPVLAMWASNLILLSSALLCLWNVGDRISTNRGSALGEFVGRVKGAFVRGPGRSGPETAAGTG